MFIAMNRFTVTAGRGAEFEEIWRNRESHFRSVPGFQRFALLRGDAEGEYISHSTWESRATFEAWTRSEQFRAAHGQSPLMGILTGPPVVSLYEAALVEEMPIAPTAAH